MKPLQEAIVLLQLARDKIETELYHRGAQYELTPDTMNQDLSDNAEDIGQVLLNLEFLDCSKRIDHRLVIRHRNSLVRHCKHRNKE